MNNILLCDLHRFGSSVKGHRVRFVKAFRRAQFASNKYVRIYYRLKCNAFAVLYGLEISPDTQIGEGFRIDHAYNITINPCSIIGKNCTLQKGVTIGCEARGLRKGAPILGDNIWIGSNAVIVGKITIGNDVLIAPNSFVNRDIPSHSVVFGNPCVVHHNPHATEGYIVFPV